MDQGITLSIWLLWTQRLRCTRKHKVIYGWVEQKSGRSYTAGLVLAAQERTFDWMGYLVD